VERIATPRPFGGKSRRCIGLFLWTYFTVRFGFASKARGSQAWGGCSLFDWEVNPSLRFSSEQLLCVGAAHSISRR